MAEKANEETGLIGLIGFAECEAKTLQVEGGGWLLLPDRDVLVRLSFAPPENRYCT
jgi:hypothetical protein